MNHRPLMIANWLLCVAALVFVMVVVGGITRLTESGLSITEWKPISGALFPLSDAAWAEAFAKYRATPEYREINTGMSLSAFQFIYFWEWVHRLLGRVIGIGFALPLLWFAFRKAIPKGYGLRLVALLALGGFQGAIGWWMVKSGLVNRTDVSHFRLAVHLTTALFIIAGLVWTALDLRALARNSSARPARFGGLALIAALVLLVQLLFGAFTAGLDAGQVSNTWPLMNGHVLPEGINWAPGGVTVILNDPFLIHFIHRWWAVLVIGVLVLLARSAMGAGNRAASIAIHSTFGIQMILGIATVLSGVNITLAALHQAVGAALVASTAWGAHVVGSRRR
jgi:heme a synthase